MGTLRMVYSLRAVHDEGSLSISIFFTESSVFIHAIFHSDEYSSDAALHSQISISLWVFQ